MATAKAVAEPIDIPYIGRTGRPFHRLPAGQRRWYTKGGMSEEQVEELMQYFESIEERVRYYQAERVGIRSESVKLLTFNEGTPIEERKSRLEEVDELRAKYVEYLERIVTLKATVIEYTPEEGLMLPPLI